MRSDHYKKKQHNKKKEQDKRKNMKKRAKHIYKDYMEMDISSGLVKNKQVYTYNDYNRNILIKPRNEKQKEYFNYLKDSNSIVIIAVGSAGTGKTLLACQMGISYLLSGRINKIIITRPTIPADEDIGFLPGTLEEKMAPWLIPIFDIFYEHYSSSEVKNMVSNKIIEISPLAYMRGRTLKNAWIIADEMQNTTINQMKMMLTRIGENSRIICTGDLKQHDRLKSRNEVNGLQDFIEKFDDCEIKSNKIKIIKFTKNDVERSAIVKDILDLYGE